MNDSGFLALKGLPPLPTRGRVLRPALWGGAVAALALLCYSVATSGMNGDLRYVLACLRSAKGGGFSASDTFVHRPFFYRWFVAGLDSLTFGSTTTREMIIRIAAVLLCVATGLALRAALARRLPPRDATLTAAVVTLALAFAPKIDFLQPEWAATLLSVLAVAAALGIERPWPAAAVAAVPLGLAVMMKYSTAATALMALLLLFAVDRMRAVRLGLVTGVSSVVLFGISLLAGSRELQWAKDMPKINQGALTRKGLDPSFLLDKSASFLVDRAYLSPVVALLPAALLLLLSRQQDRRRRAELAALAVLIVLVCVAAVAVQGNWFGYHAASLPVGAAALWGLAVAAWYRAHGRPPLFFTAVTAVYAAFVPFAAQAPHAVQGVAAGWAAVLVAFLAATADLVSARGGATVEPARPGRFAAAAVALSAVVGVFCLAAAIWPGSPQLMNAGHVVYGNSDFDARSDQTARESAELDRQIPRGAPVLYLAFGDVAYFVGHPTPCRYPVPTFLQRTKFLPDVNKLPSYKENLRCVTEDPAPYAVLQRSWFQLGNVDKTLAATIEAAYDCPPLTGNSRTPVVCRLR
ncbi:hypothetical protein [Actinacidiphila glaucinigra]|uniref:hypothetical protein n=1 Tax=Actinacidiphila glaucinigra TaxID=235986 RepID=UPI00366DDF1E